MFLLLNKTFYYTIRTSTLQSCFPLKLNFFSTFLSHCGRNSDHHTPSDWLRRAAILCNWTHPKMHLLLYHKCTTSTILLTFIHKTTFCELEIFAQSQWVAASRKSVHTDRLTATATRRDSTCSFQLQWVADSCNSSQGYHTPSDSLQLASCRQSRCVASVGVG